MDDLISRQATIDALDVLCQEHRYRIPGKRETYSEYNEAWQDALDRAEGLIFNLPTIQPEPHEGEWEQVSAQRYFMSASYFYRCSACGVNNVRNTNYCPNCGSYNGGGRK